VRNKPTAVLAWFSPLLSAPCSTLAGGHGLSVGTPLVPTRSGRRGAQRRARAAPLGAGTGATRSHAQPPLGGEHGEHGEDPPLARSEHRGICCVCPVIPVIHASRGQLPEELTDKLSGCAPKCPCQAPQSARAKRPKVPVDKSLFHNASLQSARASYGEVPVPIRGSGRRCRRGPSQAAGCAARSSPVRPTRCRLPGTGCARGGPLG